MGKKIYLVRHAETTLNTLNRLQGCIDSPLTDKGVRDSIKFSNLLSNTNVKYVYSSNSLRAIKTAEILCGKSEGRINYISKESAFDEWNFGIFEGATMPEFLTYLRKNLGDASYSYLNTHLEDIVSQIQNATKQRVESFTDITKRLMMGLEKIYKDSPSNGDILVVTHAFVMKTILSKLQYKFLDELNIQALNSMVVLEKRNDNLILSDIKTIVPQL